MSASGKETRIMMPDSKSMMDRLCAVNKEPYFQERLYPHMIEAAGLELVPFGVALLLIRAMQEFTHWAEPLNPIQLRVNELYAERFIDALIDDKAAAAEALERYKQLRRG